MDQPGNLYARQRGTGARETAAMARAAGWSFQADAGWERQMERDCPLQLSGGRRRGLSRTAPARDASGDLYGTTNGRHTRRGHGLRAVARHRRADTNRALQLLPQEGCRAAGGGRGHGRGGRPLWNEPECRMEAQSTGSPTPPANGRRPCSTRSASRMATGTGLMPA